MIEMMIVISVLLLTFSYRIVHKGVGVLPLPINEKVHIYIWGIISIIISLFLIDSPIYYLQKVNAKIISIILIICFINIVVAKYASYKMVGVYNIINFVVFYPIFEEVIFRGIILNLLNNLDGIFVIEFFEFTYLPVTLSILIAAFLFSIAHLQYYPLNGRSVRYLTFAFVGGVLLGAIMNETGSIFIPILLHIVFNFSAYYFNRG